VSAAILFTRAAESWRIEGPRGFGRRTVRYFLRLGRPAIGEPIGAFAPHRLDQMPQIEELRLDEAKPRSPGLYGPVQDDIALVEQMLDSLKPNDFPFLARALDHVLSAGGKRVRPALALLAGRFERYELDQLVPLAASIELLHSATLVHDDVIDAAPTRRGRETANSLFDNAATVMVGDYMFAHAAELVARTGNIDVIRLFAYTLMRMATGELHQDVSAYAYSQSMREYFNRIAGKTASLFATAAQGGAMIGGCRPEWVEALRVYGENLGMAFQIVDDILDFTGDEAELGKPAGSDLASGTLTLPSLLLIERYPDNNPVERYFAGRQKAQNLSRALQMIRESDILDKSYAVAYDFRDRALAALEALPAREERDVLQDLAHYVTTRRS
jgi:heptaprenyl diphosphate synthase/octaprenyl-diphosphate synthase